MFRASKQQATRTYHSKQRHGMNLVNKAYGSDVQEMLDKT